MIEMEYISPAARFAVYRKLAQRYLPTEIVSVRLVKTLSHHGDGFGGEVYWQDERFVIELLQGMDYAEEARLLFHELGHLVKGHVPKIEPQPPTRLDEMRDRWAVKGKLVAPAQARYDRREREADEWGECVHNMHKAAGEIW